MSDIYERFPNADILEKLRAQHAEAQAGRGNIDDIEALSFEAAEEIKRLRFLVKAFGGIASDSIRQGWRRAPWRVPRGDV